MSDLKTASEAVLAQRFHEAAKRLKAVVFLAEDHGTLPLMLACLGECSRRRLGVWPHPVQYAGARALLLGRLVEMQTGEGKTLVAMLAAGVMGGSGAAVHVISTNDYLARRDSEEMSPVLACFGLTTGYIQSGMGIDDRRSGYAKDICYSSGKEVVFDYLKDRLAGHGSAPRRVTHLHELVMAESNTQTAPLIPALHFAIVDEADGVLIDEASTPMILSRESVPVFSPELLDWAIESANRLQPGRDFRIGTAREVEVMPGALALCASLPDTAQSVWKAASWREHLLRQALIALHLFRRDQHYILVDDKVQIVDESTGRVMPDRSWEQGLHQLIETKEKVPVTMGRETLERMTYQRFFRRYFLLSGLTGTAVEASRELWSVYRLRVRRMPPNRHSNRIRLPDLCTSTLDEKWAAVAEDACLAAARGQPVLIGTRSVQASEQIALELRRRNIEHVVLNARQDANEARVVSLAGESGRITVATNMAGRGTDIKLDARARAAGGLHVILTEFHESPRIDRQLFGRSGRQGEPGAVRAIVSVADALFKDEKFLLRSFSNRRASVLQRWMLRSAVRRAQRRAERRAYTKRLISLRHDRDLHRLIGIAGTVT